MQIAIDLPNDFVSFQSTAEIEKDMRLSYSLWLFKQAKITITQAAELAHLNIYDFMAVCKQNQVPVIDISPQELLDELAEVVEISDDARILGTVYPAKPTVNTQEQEVAMSEFFGMHLDLGVIN